MMFKRIIKIAILLFLALVIIIIVMNPIFLKSLAHRNIMVADDQRGKVKSSLTYSLNGYSMRIYGKGPMSQHVPNSWKEQLMTLSTGWVINIKSVEVDEGVTYISSGAFIACSSLDSVILPKSLKRIGPRCFSYCSRLNEITYRGNKSDWNKIMVKSAKWNYESSIKAIHCTDGIVKV